MDDSIADSFLLSLPEDLLAFICKEWLPINYLPLLDSAFLTSSYCCYELWWRQLKSKAMIINLINCANQLTEANSKFIFGFVLSKCIPINSMRICRNTNFDTFQRIEQKVFIDLSCVHTLDIYTDDRKALSIVNKCVNLTSLNLGTQNYFDAVNQIGKLMWFQLTHLKLFLGYNADQESIMTMDVPPCNSLTNLKCHNLPSRKFIELIQNNPSLIEVEFQHFISFGEFTLLVKHCKHIERLIIKIEDTKDIDSSTLIVPNWSLISCAICVDYSDFCIKESTAVSVSIHNTSIIMNYLMKSLLKNLTELRFWHCHQYEVLEMLINEHCNTLKQLFIDSKFPMRPNFTALILQCKLLIYVDVTHCQCVCYEKLQMITSIPLSNIINTFESLPNLQNLWLYGNIDNKRDVEKVFAYCKKLHKQGRRFNFSMASHRGFIQWLEGAIVIDN